MDAIDGILERRLQILQDEVLRLESALEDARLQKRRLVADVDEQRDYVEDLLAIIRSNNETKGRLHRLANRKNEVRDLLTHLPKRSTPKPEEAGS